MADKSEKSEEPKSEEPKVVDGYIGEAKVHTSEETAKRLGSQFSTKAPAKNAASGKTEEK